MFKAESEVFQIINFLNCASKGELSEKESHLALCANCARLLVRQSGELSFAIAEKLIQHYACKWKHYSGSKRFPVPYCGDVIADDTARYAFHSRTVFHLSFYDGEYGTMRKKLADFIAMELMLDILQRGLTDLNELIFS